MMLQKLRSSIFPYHTDGDAGHSVWLIDVNRFNAYIDVIKSYLSYEEIRRSEEIKIEKNKALFCLRKGMTRIILSCFLDVAPNEINYCYSANGKPYLSHGDYNDFRFNLSHSKEYLLVGIVSHRDIGVDIEKLNLKLDYSLLAGSVLSPQELALYNAYDGLRQRHAFYRAWVQKEAISKALGMGISIGFNKLSVNIDPDFNDIQYCLNINDHDLYQSIDVKVKFERDYYFSTALIR